MKNTLLYQITTFLFIVGIVILNFYILHLKADGAFVLTVFEMWLVSYAFWNTNAIGDIIKKIKEEGDK